MAGTASLPPANPAALDSNSPINFRYDAFITYSRKDLRFATQLQEDMERRLSRFAKKYTHLRRSISICRDETDFTAAGKLSSEIVEKIRDSKCLIVICSPEARSSSWVNTEINTYRATRVPDGSNVIIAIICKGDDPVRDTAFPTSLLSENEEPLAIDFRQHKFSSSREYKRYSLNDGLLRILAPLLGTQYPDLKNRHQEYERARLNKLRWITVAAAVVFACLAILAETQRRLAQTRLDDALGVARKVVFDLEYRLRPIAGAASVRSALVKEAAELLDRLERNAKSNTERLNSRAAAFTMDGYLALQQGNIQAALHAYKSAAQIAEELQHRDPSDIILSRNLANVYDEIGKGAMSTKDLEQAATALNKSLAIRELLLQAQPLDEDLIKDLAKSKRHLGDLARERGNWMEATKQFRESIELLTIAKASDQNEESKIEVMQIESLLKGVDFLQPSRSADFDMQVTQLEELIRQNPDNAEYSYTLWRHIFDKSMHLLVENHISQARTSASKALKIILPIAEAEPSNTTYMRALTTTYRLQGNIAKADGKIADARRFYDKAWSIVGKIKSTEPENAEYALEISSGYQALGRLGIERHTLRDATTDFTKSLNTAPSPSLPVYVIHRAYLARDLVLLGLAYESIQQFDNARHAYQQALNILTESIAVAKQHEAEPDWDTVNKMNSQSFAEGQVIVSGEGEEGSNVDKWLKWQDVVAKGLQEKHTKLVKLSNGKQYRVVISNGTPAAVRTEAIRVTFLGVVLDKTDHQLQWRFEADFLKRGNFDVRIKSPLNEQRVWQGECQGPGVITHIFFGENEAPELWVWLKETGSSWIPFEFTFTHKIDGSTFNIIQWTSFDEIAKKKLAEAQTSKT
jgi:eukaryotic-like serine/threonine-protein kinase